MFITKNVIPAIRFEQTQIQNRKSRISLTFLIFTYCVFRSSGVYSSRFQKSPLSYFLVWHVGGFDVFPDCVKKEAC